MNCTLPIDFSNLLENPDDYDVKIIVGKEENIKEFKAHSLILSSRSIYFKNGLSARWARKEDGIIIFNKPNISPLVFEVIIKYIYTGLLYIKDNNEINLIDVAIAADELQLIEVFQQLEETLTGNSQEDFKIKKFHENCDNKGPTVVVIKVHDSGEIIGGYNPLEWRSFKILEDERSPILYHNCDFYNNHQRKSSNSFIFSLTNRTVPVLSRVTSKREAITWCKNKGPCFGLHDLFVYSLNNNIAGKSKQHSYEKKVINKEAFEIEEYEVFQIVDDRYKSIIFLFIDIIFRFINRMFKRVIRFIKWMLGKFVILLPVIFFMLVLSSVISFVFYFASIIYNFYQQGNIFGVIGVILQLQVSVVFLVCLQTRGNLITE
ncbi:unnamed protein product [Rhizophagus irregularis]|nr:unnamed protein product [Rhizophagus irregularis]